MKKVSWVGELLAGVVLTGILMIGFVIFGPTGSGGEAREIVIHRGWGVRQIGRVLVREDIIYDAGNFVTLANLCGIDTKLKAGRYTLTRKTNT